jgi:hypothetical protein
MRLQFFSIGEHGSRMNSGYRSATRGGAAPFAIFKGCGFSSLPLFWFLTFLELTDFLSQYQDFYLVERSTAWGKNLVERSTA